MYSIHSADIFPNSDVYILKGKGDSASTVLPEERRPACFAQKIWSGLWKCDD